MSLRFIMFGRRATPAASLCLLALAAACLLAPAWRPAAASSARAASATTAAGCAVVNLNAARQVTVGVRPLDTAAGDFNGDGRQDIVVANGSSGFVTLVYGSASGLFAPTSLETGSTGQVAAADFNNDGKDDLLVGRTQSLVVRLGDGAGGFGTPIESATGSGSASPVVVADFNNDGNRDVFVGSSSSSSSRVMLGNGAGGFSSTGLLPLPTHSFADAGDFNGDGRIDLVLAGGSDFFFLAPGDGAGHFGQPTLFSIPTSGPLAATDLNGDGKLDVVMAGQNFVAVRLGDGAGGFGPASIFTTNITAVGLAVADLDGDGKTDVALVGSGSGDLFGVMLTLSGDGAGSFGPAAVFRTGVTETTSVVAGDFNGDGRREVAASNASGTSVTGQTPGTLSVFLGDTAGGLAAPVLVNAGTSPSSISAGDLNSDGRPDIAVAGFSSTVHVALGNALTLFGTPAPVNVGAAARSVKIADATGDGKLDLLTANFDANTVSVLRGDGAGGFVGQPLQLSSGSSPTHVLAADFDNDNRPDIGVVTSFGRLTVFRGDGAGGFNSPTGFNIGSDAWHVSAGDLNGDGHTDLVASTTGGVAVLLNNGAGGFAPALRLTTATSVEGTAVGDFNGDGKADIAAAHLGSAFVTVLLGDGAGAFGAAKTYPVGSGSASIVAADLDGDGDTDLAATNSRGTVSVLAGDGAGEFAPAAAFASGGHIPRSLVAGDFDGDGATDLAVANSGGSIFLGPSLSGVVSVILNGCDTPPPAPPRLIVEGAAVSEGDTGTRNATFTVRLSATSAQSVTVSHYPVGETATRHVDFLAPAGRLTFNPGEVFKTVTVPVVGDPVDEFDETFALVLVFPLNAVVDGAASSSATILDDDPPPSISVSDVTLAEGSVTNGVALFNVTRSALSAKPVTVAYSTADGTAQAGADYEAASGLVTFGPGETSKTVSVNLVADSLVEPDENFFLNLSNPTNATLADAQGAATLLNDDAVVQLAAGGYSATEGADRSVLVTVMRTGELSGVSLVSYATSDETASERKDYTAALGRVRFAPGETSKTFEIVITDDRFAEGAEIFHVMVTGAVGAEVGPQRAAAVTINSDDTAGGPSPVKDGSFDTEFFVRQHYADFLNRVPDAGGLAFWVGGIESCGADQQCREVKKVDTSAAFFLSIEFQETGFLAYRAHKAAFGDLPNTPGVPIRLRPFLSDARRIGDGVIVGTPGWPEQLEANKQAYFAEFITRAEFIALSPPTLNAAQYVDGLFARAGITPTLAERQAAVSAYGAGGTAGRAAALRSVAESQTLKQAETNKAFVLMQYFGYLRRNPDDPQDTNFDGYIFWLQKLNSFNGNYVEAEMVKAFIQSIEYGDRFGH